MPKGYWDASRQLLKGIETAGKCPNTSCQPIGEEAELPSDYWQKHGNFCPFSLKRCVSVFIYYKSQELWKILNTFCGSFLVFALSNHTTFSQTQTDASPFNCAVLTVL
jgi:hypothetical protein